ncbi:thioredoxin family protein [Bacillus sp. FJAT-47783]|uniref:thioredoxin family protein n=1 Tax=Bacillus sp. FJAT-47783 TaxID=2922712 RepID=UPI001FABB7B6|nr:thioredoxin family protein [Bacillus sp. FJAT-47783]
MIIKVLGTGCAKCKRLEKNVEAAVEDLRMDASIVKVTDFKEIAKYGVMSTPALVVNDQLVVSGKVPKSEEIKKYLK